MNKNEFEVSVEKLVYGGDGLARLEGRVVFAPFVLPGERARVRSELEKPGMVKASLAGVKEPSAERIAALCPYFGRCGGCHYQHAGYDFQLSVKRQILVEELRRLGKVEPPAEIAIVSGEPWGYRNRAQLHIENGRLGYREARSHKLCAIDRCPISSPRVNEAIGILNGMLRDPRWPRFVRGIEVFTDEERVQLNVLDTERPIARRFFEWCTEKIPGMVENALDYGGRFRVSRNSFFQVNRFLLDKLVGTATGGASGDSALDLYAGVGLFSMALARSFAKVMAVESGSTAVRDLLFNAERAGLRNISANAATTEAYLEKLEAAPNLVLLDPPRAGLGKVVVRRLAELKPRFVTVVSCDPATLARDLSGLLAGGYRISEMSLVDLFPQTYHLETVARLEYAG